MITKEEVAKAAGVSTATVSRVISGVGYVSKESEEKVLRAIDDLRYIPNKIARNLAKKGSNVIAVLVEDLFNPYYMQLVDAMVERANEKEHLVSLFTVKNRNMKGVLDDLAGNRVRGIVNLAMFTCDFSLYDVFADAGTSLINCRNTGPRVVVDYPVGMREAFDLLRRKGIKDVAFISGLEPWLSNKDSRVQCYLASTEEYGFTCDERLLLCGDYPAKRAHTVGYELCAKMIESGVKFDAIFCMTDMMALGAMKALYDHGLKIPDDVSVVGCDNLDFTGNFQPALTTVDVDIRAEGYAFVDLILGGDEKRVITIPTGLKIRDSVRR